MKNGFCTLNSLQAIKRMDDTSNMEVIMLSERIIEALMLDNNMDEKRAADIYYTSKTFALLSDNASGFYLKTWQHIYEMLNTELKM